MKDMRDFEIIMEAFQSSYPNNSRKPGDWDKGYIVKYDGDIYFIETGENIDIEECIFWSFDIEKHFCVHDIDTEYYTYWSMDHKKIDVAQLI